MHDLIACQVVPTIIGLVAVVGIIGLVVLSCGAIGCGVWYLGVGISKLFDKVVPTSEGARRTIQFVGRALLVVYSCLMVGWITWMLTSGACTIGQDLLKRYHGGPCW